MAAPTAAAKAGPRKQPTPAPKDARADEGAKTDDNGGGGGGGRTEADAMETGSPTAVTAAAVAKCHTLGTRSRNRSQQRQRRAPQGSHNRGGARASVFAAGEEATAAPACRPRCVRGAAGTGGGVGERGGPVSAAAEAADCAALAPEPARGGATVVAVEHRPRNRAVAGVGDGDGAGVFGDGRGEPPKPVLRGQQGEHRKGPRRWSLSWTGTLPRPTSAPSRPTTSAARRVPMLRRGRGGRFDARQQRGSSTRVGEVDAMYDRAQKRFDSRGPKNGVFLA